MKVLTRIALAVGLAVAMAGCAGTRGYLVDRARDARDIATLTVGFGVGAKAQCGPVNAGAIVNMDVYGLRGGKVYTFDGNIMPYSMDVEALCFGAGRYRCLTMYEHGYLSNERGKSIPTWWFCSFKYKRTYIRRGQETTRHNIPCYIPFLRFPGSNPRDEKHPWYYYTQIDVIAGLGPSVRLGFNPGELLDFLFGWVGVDIYNDDLKRRARKRARTETHNRAAMDDNN